MFFGVAGVALDIREISLFSGTFCIWPNIWDINVTYDTYEDPQR